MTKSLLEEMWDKINNLETKVEGLELWAKGIGEEVAQLISPLREEANKKLLARVDALEQSNKGYITSDADVLSPVELIDNEGSSLSTIRFTFVDGTKYFLLLSYDAYNPNQFVAEMRCWLNGYIVKARKEGRYA